MTRIIEIQRRIELHEEALEEARNELSKEISNAMIPPVDTGCQPDDERKNTAIKRQVGGNHYLSMGVQVWDVVDTWPKEQQIGFYRGGALKYVMRMGNKDVSAQEIAKGTHYLEKLTEVLK